MKVCLETAAWRLGIIGKRRATTILIVAVSVTILGISAVRIGSSKTLRSPENIRSATTESVSPRLPPPLEGPAVVAIQPGHWKIDELPAEAVGRGRGIGAVHGEVRELDINLAVVDALMPMLEAEGYSVLVIPATVPPGLRVDAFISIHADWGWDPERKGWKLAPPWRPSQVSSDLARSLEASFQEESMLQEDVGGVTVGMRGYFGFSPDRYLHAISPYTPAVLIELGFVTNEDDRNLMVSRPEYYAGIIRRGLVRHLDLFDRADTARLVPKTFGLYRVGEDGSQAYVIPDVMSEVTGEFGAGSIIRPVDESDEWFEVFFRNPFRIAWIPKADVVSVSPTRR